MPEYVIVTYPRVRDVFIDGERSGQTNQPLVVREGEQEFHLGKPVDYRPRRHVVVVTGTTSGSPLPIPFAPKP